MIRLEILLFDAIHLNMELFSVAGSVLSPLSLFHTCARTDISSHVMWLQMTRYQCSNVERLSPYLFHLANNLLWMFCANDSRLYTDVISACEKLGECFTTNLGGHYSRPCIVCEYPSVFSTILSCSAVIRKLFGSIWKPKIWWIVDQWRSYGSGFFADWFFFFLI